MKAATCDHVIEFKGTPIASIKISFRKAARHAGPAGVTPHTLRHTAATWMVMEGVPLEEVARYLGATKQIVERVYGKPAPDYLRRAAAALKW
ncbi:MAG: tyrosine-type recombinase/integrase [Rhodospirillales bacterium]|nr:tyrosine-type recombinase/integrase [Rhodospirillales bacterium]